MNQTRRLLAIFCCLTIACLAAAGCTEKSVFLPHAAALNKIKVVGVLPFVDAPGVKDSGDKVLTAVAQQLYQCPNIKVVERKQLKAIIDEQDLAAALADDPVAAAGRIGKAVGADAIFIGELTQYEAQQESSHLAVSVVSGGGTKHIHRVGISVRGINVRDQMVIYAQSGGGVSNEGYSPAIDEAAAKAMSPFVKLKQQGPSPAPQNSQPPQ
ncbi:MAG: hypothetical protein HZA50_17730 [Planctomycetes bacterium]|nr:hypothetical protein [Planctomycetota bacterium]